MEKPAGRYGVGAVGEADLKIGRRRSEKDQALGALVVGPLGGILARGAGPVQVGAAGEVVMGIFGYAGPRRSSSTFCSPLQEPSTWGKLQAGPAAWARPPCGPLMTSAEPGTYSRPAGRAS